MQKGCSLPWQPERVYGRRWGWLSSETYCVSSERENGLVWLLADKLLHYTLIANLMHWLLFIHKRYSPLHVSSIKCSSSGGHSCIQAAYGTVTLYKSSWWPVDTQLQWELTVGGRLLVGRLKTPYHMLHMYNYVLLKMSTWCSKHVEEDSILWINQCIKLVINV